MFFDPIEIPDELLDAQQQGKLVVFAGAGVSMGTPSNLPNFKGLAAFIAGTHPLAAEINQYENRLDSFLGKLARQQVDVQTLCRQRIADPDSKPTDLHRWLVDLFGKPQHVRIVTTNFDLHFRTVIEERGWKVDYFHAPALPLGDNFSGVVHPHGCISRPEPLVLTDVEFGRAYLSQGWARDFLHRLFSEYTTLFVGYSHSDLPVEYLALGMSGGDLAPRFALTAEDSQREWTSLGVKQITFKKERGDRYQNQNDGVRKWATFTKQQPIDITERVKSIVNAPEKFTPDRADSSFLKLSLSRDKSCHFFTDNARGWRWVKWLHEQGLLAPLFDPCRREPTNREVRLGKWLADALLAEESDEGLLLVEKYGGYLSRLLWSDLCRNLRHDQVDWTNSLIQRWVLVLSETCHPDWTEELTSLLPYIAKVAPITLGMALFRRLTAIRVVMHRRFQFAARTEDGAAFPEAADLELVLSAEAHELQTSWRECFQPKLPQLRETLLSLLTSRLVEAHELYLSAHGLERASHSYCFRTRINERASYLTRDVDLLLDFLLDVLEDGANEGWSLPQEQIVTWLASGVPVLVRLGLYALHLSTEIPKNVKVELVRKYEQVHPAVDGATHEAWLVLSESYPALNLEERESLWRVINEGPTGERPNDVPPETWEEWRTSQIDNLTWFVGSKNAGCPEAAQALNALNERQPDFQGHDALDQLSFGEGGVFQGSQTPKSATDLLNSPPDSQMDFLLSYQGGEAPLQPSREGLLNAVGSACAQSQDWCLALLEELGLRNEWNSDLWRVALPRLSLSGLAKEKLTWLLTTLETHFSGLPGLPKLGMFLLQNVDFSPEKRPGKEILDLMIRVSLLVWQQLTSVKHPVTTGFRTKEWTNTAINHPAGQIAEFWLRACAARLDESGQPLGFPEWLIKPLEEMVAGKSYASQLGRVMLGQHLRLLYHLDPAWVRAELFPKFQFSKSGEEAFLVWEPHAGYGALSRDLILVMMPIYREAFQHFHAVIGRLQNGFFHHIATIIYSCLTDVDEENWFRDFFLSLSEEERAKWANVMEGTIREAPEARKAQIWNRWMKDYWSDRVFGRPCPLSVKEAEEMVEWALGVGEAFPDAVQFIVQGPRPGQNFLLGSVLNTLKTHEAPVKYPEAVLKLLVWLLEEHDPDRPVSRNIQIVLFRLPKQKRFLPALNTICQHLTSCRYPATELKHRIEQEFTA